MSGNSSLLFLATCLLLMAHPLSAGVIRDALGLDSLTSLLPLPCCRPCTAHEEVPCPQSKCHDCPSVDYSEAKAAGTGKALDILLKGKELASSVAGKVASPFVYKYDLISSGASSLPDILASKGHVLGQILAAPINFSAQKSALLATGLAHVIVGIPTAIGTGVYAGAAGLIDAYNNVQDQKERINNCLNPTPEKPCLKKPYHEEKVIIQSSSSDDIFKDLIPNDPATESIIPGAVLNDQGMEMSQRTDTSTEVSQVKTTTFHGLSNEFSEAEAAIIAGIKPFLEATNNQ